MGKDNVKVFVYGSLKKGYINNRLFLHNSNFICKAKTLDSNYDMVSLGGFPAMENGGGYYISGEVYKVNKETLKHLDGLEGNGYFYTREKIRVIPIDEESPTWFYAWAYIISSSHSSMSSPIQFDDFNTKNWEL